MPDMEQPTATITPRPGAARAPADASVAETMRRVHAQLRSGRAPSFEALLALGEPTRG